MECGAGRTIAENTASLVGQKIGQLEVAASGVAVILRQIGLPAYAGVHGEAAVHTPGILHIRADIVLPFILALRVGLRKATHLTQ